jgi:hypothetical protein
MSAKWRIFDTGMSKYLVCRCATGTERFVLEQPKVGHRYDVPCDCDDRQHYLTATKSLVEGSVEWVAADAKPASMSIQSTKQRKKGSPVEDKNQTVRGTDGWRIDHDLHTYQDTVIFSCASCQQETRFTGMEDGKPLSHVCKGVRYVLVATPEWVKEQRDSVPPIFFI